MTGSAFLDPRLYFPLYQQAAAGIALVDELFNCEDILMNFVAAHATRSSPAVLFVRPRLRIDVSFTSGELTYPLVVRVLRAAAAAVQLEAGSCFDA